MLKAKKKGNNDNNNNNNKNNNNSKCIGNRNKIAAELIIFPSIENLSMNITEEKKLQFSMQYSRRRFFFVY